MTTAARTAPRRWGSTPTSAEVDLVASVASQVSRRLSYRVDPRDLESLGLVVLCDAARRHDPSRTAFTPYLVDRLRWAMMSDARREVRRDRLLRKAQSRDQAFTHAPDPENADPDRLVQEADPAGCPHTALEGREARSRLRVGLASLSPEQRAVVVRHYFGGELLEDIASELGRCKAYVTRLHQQGLRRLGTEFDDDEPSRTVKRSASPP
ncbi:MAG: sigma-70 family RNA polymerase sigma factor [Deltaproteobacteria bacterium]|nr:sigma-70 family RNA polymerase sigma factor [Deltaproteobacteria bacterium]